MPGVAQLEGRVVGGAVELRLHLRAERGGRGLRRPPHRGARQRAPARGRRAPARAALRPGRRADDAPGAGAGARRPRRWTRSPWPRTTRSCRSSRACPQSPRCACAACAEPRCASTPTRSAWARRSSAATPSRPRCAAPPARARSAAMASAEGQQQVTLRRLGRAARGHRPDRRGAGRDLADVASVEHRLADPTELAVALPRAGTPPPAAPAARRAARRTARPGGRRRGRGLGRGARAPAPRSARGRRRVSAGATRAGG